MQLHAAAAVLGPGGTLLVYGAKDEGIRGVLNHTEDLFPSGKTIAVGGRCRMVRSERRRELRGLRGALEDWKEIFPPDHPLLPPLWVSYPGVFAHGRLDSGTKLLLEAMPPLPSGARILDYGCGSGFVASVARLKGEDLTMDMLDSDAVALEAARENVPGARVLLQEGLPDPDGVPYEAIVSNPPFHRGKREESGLILEMIRGAPGLLTREGKLLFVSQRRFQVREALEQNFSRVSVAADDSGFRVWVGEGPRQSSQEGHHGP